MSRFLVSVTAGNEEHGGTIRHSGQNSTGSDSSTSRTDLAATCGISWECTTVTADIT